jgi:hypothetical protein
MDHGPLLCFLLNCAMLCCCLLLLQTGDNSLTVSELPVPFYPALQ